MFRGLDSRYRLHGNCRDLSVRHGSLVHHSSRRHGACSDRPVHHCSLHSRRHVTCNLLVRHCSLSISRYGTCLVLVSLAS